MPLSTQDLLNGDVLLYKGSSIVGWAIRFFDGTEVNHAGLFLGSGQVGEALGSGLTSRALDESIDDCTVWVRRLTDTPPTMDPVILVAESYLNDNYKYAYNQLLLLAFLSLTRKVKITPTLNVLLRTLLDKAAAILGRLISGGRKQMICSEFVYRCYDEAHPDKYDVYHLEILRATYQRFLSKSLWTTDVGPSVLAFSIGVAHPDSLLALLRSSSAEKWLSGRPTGPGDKPDKEPKDEEIEELLVRYRTEVESREVPRKAMSETVSLEELRISADRFATALYSMIHPKWPTLTTYSQRFAFLESPEVAAMFVTPGDLLKTPSLSTMGVYP